MKNDTASFSISLKLICTKMRFRDGETDICLFFGKICQVASQIQTRTAAPLRIRASILI